LQVLALNPPELDYYLEDEWEDDEGFETLEDYHALDSDSVEPLDFEDVGKGNGSHGDGH
jgi:hypothetical protein